MDYNKLRMECMDKFIRDIKRGTYKVGEKLPSDFIAGRDFNLVRLDVRNIYSNLEAMGYIQSVRGVGRFVKRDAKVIEIPINNGESFTEKVEKTGLKIGTLNKECELILYDDEINKKFGEDIKAVYKVVRIRYLENTAIACHISYLRQDIFKEVILEEIEKISDYYKGFGIKNTMEVENKFSIEYADSEIRQLLDCRELTQIIKEEHMVIDRDKMMPIEFTRVFYIGDKFKFEL